jgi:translation initiation factor 1
VCEAIAKESQRINVYLDKKKFGKVYTVIEGIDSKEIDMKELTKKLKSKFACGGTAKEGKIELQGDHKQKVKDVLIEAGFSPETIDTK